MQLSVLENQVPFPSQRTVRVAEHLPGRHLLTESNCASTLRSRPPKCSWCHRSEPTESKPYSPDCAETMLDCRRELSGGTKHDSQ
eukprot:3936717-Rhodomonas_salina.1